MATIAQRFKIAHALMPQSLICFVVDLPASCPAMLTDEFIPAAALIGLALPARRLYVLVIVQPFAVGQIE